MARNILNRGVIFHTEERKKFLTLYIYIYIYIYVRSLLAHVVRSLLAHVVSFLTIKIVAVLNMPKTMKNLTG